MHIIGPVQTQLAPPVEFGLKKDCTLRFCVGYRILNAVTILDSYLTLSTDECIDCIGDATIFLTPDAICDYWQVEMAREDWNWTASRSNHGVFGFMRTVVSIWNRTGDVAARYGRPTQ